MKKILLTILSLSFILSSVVVADRVRDDSLGNPILNLADTAVIPRYSAALQNFPSTIYAGFQGIVGPSYNYFGIGYKASDMLALCWTYVDAPTVTAVSFWSNGNNQATINFADIAQVYYAGKAGTLGFGLGTKINFVNNQLVKTTSINSNEIAFQWVGFDGFKLGLNPSIALDLGGAGLYAQINSSLNFLKRYTTTTNDAKITSWQKPNTLESIGLNVLFFKDVDDVTSLGAELGFTFADNGYSWQVLTNAVANYKTNTYEGSTISGSLALGSKIKATEAVTFFVDVKSTLSVTSSLHKTGVNANTWFVTTIWGVPCVTLGADFELIKGLNLRISGKPTYTITTFARNSYKGWVNGTSTVTVGAFDVDAAMGLGLTLGAFKINWDLDGQNFVSELLNNPMNIIDIQGNGPQLASRVQVNYSF
jgi:hypothetical protein